MSVTHTQNTHQLCANVLDQHFCARGSEACQLVNVVLGVVLHAPEGVTLHSDGLHQAKVIGGQQQRSGAWSSTSRLGEKAEQMGQ